MSKIWPSTGENSPGGAHPQSDGEGGASNGSTACLADGDALKTRGVPEILVSWVSVQHKAAPLLTVIEREDSDLFGRVGLLVLCHRSAPDDLKESEALEKTLERLERLPDRLRPELAVRAWKTKAAPTDHAKVLEFSKGVLADLRRDHPDARINIHLSPGTKAMHAAWLILAHGGFIAGPVRLLQTRDDQFVKPGQAPLEWVTLPAETWGQLVRSSAPRDVAEDESLALWDPGQVASPAARAILDSVSRWAPLPVPILLMGERGTGKTTLAHVIRARSPFRALDRKKGAKTAWQGVVCGQFRANPGLARSELFGHRKGAFTGAESDREGALERMDGDTLFLDEIADLDRGTQRLLIAAIEGRGFQRLGEDTPRKADFRLIAATNQAVDRLAPRHGSGEEGALDADFFDRIATFVLHLPPLRERREDLPALWRSCLRRAARRLGEGLETLRPLEEERSVLAALSRHPLPGNLRDLQRAAWHAVAVLHHGDGRGAVTKAAVSALGDPIAPAPRAGDQGVVPADLEAHLRAEEHRILTGALRASAGNKARAASSVGLPRKTFEYRLRKLGLD